MKITRIFRKINCRDRWRTLRNSYLKSLRKNKSSYEEKKKYYLTDYFKFLKPFIKQQHSDANKKAVYSPSDVSKSEEDDEEEEEEDSHCSTSSSDDLVIHNSSNDLQVVNDEQLNKIDGLDSAKMNKEITEVFTSHKRPHCTHSSQTVAEAVKDSELCLKHKKCKRDEDDSDELFVKSLIRYMKEMDSRQNRRFRLKVMGLVDDILDDSDAEVEKLTSTSAQCYSSHIPIVDTIKQTHPVLSALYSAEASQKPLILPREVVYYDDAVSHTTTHSLAVGCTRQRPASTH